MGGFARYSNHAKFKLGFNNDSSGLEIDSIFGVLSSRAILNLTYILDYVLCISRKPQETAVKIYKQQSNVATLFIGHTLDECIRDSCLRVKYDVPILTSYPKQLLKQVISACGYIVQVLHCIIFWNVFSFIKTCLS